MSRIFNNDYDSVFVPGLIPELFNTDNRLKQETSWLVAQGASNKQIAAALSISVLTVKNHIYNIYKKTGANSRVDLVNLLGEKDVA